MKFQFALKLTVNLIIRHLKRSVCLPSTILIPSKPPYVV